MKYMMLIYGAENGWTPDERTACMVQSLAICEDLIAQGRFIDASPLQPVSTAVTVRVRNGRPLVTDGPFAETTEQLGGYYEVRTDDLDDLMDVCKILSATGDAVEVHRKITGEEGSS
jgi:hypothetical protein